VVAGPDGAVVAGRGEEAAAGERDHAAHDGEGPADDGHGARLLAVLDRDLDGRRWGLGCGAHDGAFREWLR
jgi:hypothetical protein